MTDIDDYYESPDDYEAAQRAAEEPPEWYLIEQAERDAAIHREQDHGGGECDCEPYWPPSCRRLLVLPRWSPRLRWHCGTPGGCDVRYHRTPLAAWRAHRQMHEVPF